MTLKIRGREFDAFNLAIVFATLVWLGFQLAVPLANRPPALDQAFMTVLGAWVTSKAMEQRKKDEKMATRVDDLATSVDESISRANVSEKRADVAEKRADKAQYRADESEVRADDSEHRESQWSQHRDHRNHDATEED